MDNYTPNTDVVRLLYAIGQGGLSDDVEDARAEDFDRWLEGVRAEERERVAGLIDAYWRGDKTGEREYQNTLPDWRMGMSDAAHIVREAGAMIAAEAAYKALTEAVRDLVVAWEDDARPVAGRIVTDLRAILAEYGADR